MSYRVKQIAGQWPPKTLRPEERLITLCQHCRQPASAHAGPECLFESSRFRPTTVGALHPDVPAYLRPEKKP